MSHTKRRHFNGERPSEGRGGLMLGRTAGDTLEFMTEHGELITVQFVELRGEEMRIRCVAPPSTRILRGDMVSRAVPERPAAVGAAATPAV